MYSCCYYGRYTHSRSTTAATTTAATTAAAATTADDSTTAAATTAAATAAAAAAVQRSSQRFLSNQLSAGLSLFSLALTLAFILYLTETAFSRAAASCAAECAFTKSSAAAAASSSWHRAQNLLSPVLWSSQHLRELTCCTLIMCTRRQR
jgi:hypothetical protein